jgi:hypothetical protein
MNHLENPFGAHLASHRTRNDIHRIHRVSAAFLLSLSCWLSVSAASAVDDQCSGDKEKAICPFHINVPESALVDLRQRIAATRWPDRETVSDGSQGVELAKLQQLVRYWGTDYDWRKTEAKLNAVPQYMTNIDGVDIQFAWIRSKYPHALPLIMIHGWPGSVIELLKTIGSLTDPPAYGGRVEDAFDLVLPSMPGYCHWEYKTTAILGMM